MRCYLMTPILLRSIVAAAATMISRPKTICWAKMSTLTKVMPMRTTEMMRAPTSVAATLPTPRSPPSPDHHRGDRGSRNSLAMVGDPLAKRAHHHAGQAGGRARDNHGGYLDSLDWHAGGQRQVRRTDGPAPAAKERVAFDERPDEQDGKADKDLVRQAVGLANDPEEDGVAISGGIGTERMPDNNSAALAASPPTASVAMKEGTRSFVCAIPLASPSAAPLRSPGGWRRRRGPRQTARPRCWTRDATDCPERSMLPSMTTKVMPAASTKSVAVSVISVMIEPGVRNTGETAPTMLARTTSVIVGTKGRS